MGKKKKYVSINRHGSHNIRNGIAWAQTGHGPHRRSDAQDDLCRWIMDSSARRNLKNRGPQCWSHAKEATQWRGRCWFREKELTSPGLRKEQQHSWISLGTTELHSDATTNQRSRRWQGKFHQEGSQTVPERPPVGESQSNGITERTVGLIAGQARTLKAALEHRIGAMVPPGARILCWLVELAACLMIRCDIGSDGRRRCRGCMDEGTTRRFWNLVRRFCTRLTNQQAGEGGACGSTLDYSSEC